MDPVSIIEKFYEKDSFLYKTLIEHSKKVRDKSLEIAKHNAHLNPDLELIENGAMLHDIGIFLTKAKSIGCYGDKPYVCHGYLGRKLLDDLDLPVEYGLVCERHTGAGITKENIIKNNLPLPERDMVPITLEEKIICVADKYHSKSPKKADLKLTTQDIIKELNSISPGHARRFSAWAKKFNI